jgi:hypothetical protein
LRAQMQISGLTPLSCLSTFFTTNGIVILNKPLLMQMIVECCDIKWKIEFIREFINVSQVNLSVHLAIIQTYCELKCSILSKICNLKKYTNVRMRVTTSIFPIYEHSIYFNHGNVRSKGS